MWYFIIGVVCLAGGYALGFLTRKSAVDYYKRLSTSLEQETNAWKNKYFSLKRAWEEKDKKGV